MRREAKKGKNVRLYIYEDDEPRLNALCDNTGLTITSALSLIVTAGLQALERDKYRFTLPLRFYVGESYPELRSQNVALNEREGKKK